MFNRVVYLQPNWSRVWFTCTVVASVVLCELEARLLEGAAGGACSGDGDIGDTVIPLPSMGLATNTTIEGTFHTDTDKLTIEVFSRENENEIENCCIVLSPRNNTLDVYSKIQHKQIEYDLIPRLSPNKYDFVTFTFKLMASSIPNEDDVLDIAFEGNAAGLQNHDLPCSFTSLRTIDRIVLRGARHKIKQLLFQYS